MEPFVAPNGNLYAIFVLNQYVTVGDHVEVRVRDYADTYSDCLGRLQIELEIRPGATLACIVQYHLPLPEIYRDGVDGLLLMAIVGLAIMARRRLTSA